MSEAGSSIVIGVVERERAVRYSVKDRHRVTLIWQELLKNQDLVKHRLIIVIKVINGWHLRSSGKRLNARFELKASLNSSAERKVRRIGEQESEAAR